MVSREDAETRRGVEAHLLRDHHRQKYFSLTLVLRKIVHTLFFDLLAFCQRGDNEELVSIYGL